jgi:hypothetical protein
MLTRCEVSSLLDKRRLLSSVAHYVFFLAYAAAFLTMFALLAPITTVTGCESRPTGGGPRRTAVSTGDWGLSSCTGGGGSCRERSTASSGIGSPQRSSCLTSAIRSPRT